LLIPNLQMYWTYLLIARAYDWTSNFCMH